MPLPSAQPSLVFEAVDNRVQRSPYGHLQHAWRYRAFFLYWVRRSLVTRYRQTSLGWLWAILQPLLSSLIFVVIFSSVLQVHSDPVPYPLFIVTNLVLWSYFSRVVLIGGGTVTGYMELLRQIRFPREFLPLAVWVESLVDLSLGMCIVALGFALYHYPVTEYLPVALLVFIVETLLALAVSLLLAALSVFIRDLLQVSGLLLQLLLYLSPVIYPLTTVPESIKRLFFLNPLGIIFASYQEALFFGRFTLARELFLAGLVSALLLALSYVVFKRVEWQFADVL